MVLCELYLGSDDPRIAFLIVWLSLNVIGFFTILSMSGLMFYYGYQHPTYAMWRHKSNPKFPEVSQVREEIVQTMKGMFSATLCPTISIWLAHRHFLSQAFCGWGPSPQEQYSVGYQVLTFFIVWLGNDFWSFYYHRLGHTTKIGWSQHRPHHHFGNPSPFAVIADEPVDQFLRAMPLFLFPMAMPMNIDLVFAIYALFFYGYGVYLHSGYEYPGVSAHQNFVNTSFQHYLHHARSSMNTPYHTGFYFKIWDQLFGSTYTEACICAQCCQQKGERTEEQFQQQLKAKPDYSVLLTLSPSFWLESNEKKPKSN